MRTLNRPMFRYGGPIKEGVMNGIREPKRNGGSMSNNEGPRRAALVGNDVFPRTGGRENHLVQIPIGIGMGLAAAGRAALRFAPQIARGARRIFGKTTTKPASFTPVRIKTTGGYSEYGPASYTKKALVGGSTKGGLQGSQNIGKLGGTEVFTPNILGRDPLIQLGGKIISGVTNPAVTGKLAGAARLVFSPSGAVIGGLYYANGKFFNKKGEPVPKPDGDIKIGGKVGTSGAPGGGDPDMKYNEPGGYVTDAEKEAATIASRKKQMDMYKEIMDIKGMKKDATYKSLIDASQAILAEDDFKGSIKDGSLISKLIGVTSKRFDKVSDTETALRSLVAKGEIDKDLNKDKNALDNAVKNAQLRAYEKQLAGKSMAEIISTRMEKGDMFQGSELASLLRVKKGIDAKVLPSGKMEQGQDPLEYITSVVTTVNADETTPDYPDGVYVIKDRIIQVLEGKVIPVSINQLT